jgi:hypothetical protein
MLYPLLLLSLALADEPAKTDRPPSIIAPSLPQLTREEERKLDEVIDRFILADTGRLGPSEAKKATAAFDKLGHEAIPALIRGLNKAATLKHSCPTLMISQKLARLLLASNDQQLLEFARDEIGAGVTRSPHAGTLQDLRVRVLLRKNALARRGPASPATGPMRLGRLSTADLAKQASTLRGAPLHATLRELAKRDGKEVLPALALAAGSYDKETQKLGRELLDAHLGRQSRSAVAERLDDENAEIKRGALRVIAEKHPDLMTELIERLGDDDAGVRGEARDALKKLSKGEDFGPAADATKEQRSEAQRRWRAWWEKKTGGK